METAAPIAETVLKSYRDLLDEAGHQTHAVTVSQRNKQPVFVLSGDAEDLEAYTNVPVAHAGVPVLRRLLEDLTAVEAVVICNTLRRLRRGEPVPVEDPAAV